MRLIKSFAAFPEKLRVPEWICRWLSAYAQDFLFADDDPRADFLKPAGEPAFARPDSVAWQVFKNPVTLFIGGVAAVLMELGEPRVRSGVWCHTGFRTDPLRRLRRTGLAAMMTVYGARSQAEATIAHINRMHQRVSGVTPGGVTYHATDPELLLWVNATAQFGFAEAYRHFGAYMSDAEISQFYSEGQEPARLLGVTAPVQSANALEALFQQMRPMMEPSPVIFEFLSILKTAPILPPGTGTVQSQLIRAGIDLLPGWMRQRLELGDKWSLARWERNLIRFLGHIANKAPLYGTPPTDACLRLGLPADYLFASRHLR